MSKQDIKFFHHLVDNAKKSCYIFVKNKNEKGYYHSEAIEKAVTYCEEGAYACPDNDDIEYLQRL